MHFSSTRYGRLPRFRPAQMILLAVALEFAQPNTWASSNFAAPLPNGRHCVTNTAQFAGLADVDYLGGCDFRLTGVVTLVDHQRDLVVLQDATGAVALNFPTTDAGLSVGQLITVDGSNCCPLLASFPDYPYRPSGRKLSASFEAPANWGYYNLTRMRGYLHPPASGDYRFWIASDNSSELWLSTDATPINARKIAGIPRFGWTDARDWGKYSSQASGSIHLIGGETYYIEAQQEQTTGNENLSVTWLGPGLGQSVIDGRYLTPWNDGPVEFEPATCGILREYWTNYTAGSVDDLGGTRPFASALTVQWVQVQKHGPGVLPAPAELPMNRPLEISEDYRWTTVSGIVEFKAFTEDTAILDLFDGQETIQVRITNVTPETAREISEQTNAILHVSGVCEELYDAKQSSRSKLIWTTAPKGVWFLPDGRPSAIPPEADSFTTSTNVPQPATPGFFGIQGVVTFNDRVFDKDCLYIQEGDLALQVSPENPLQASALKVGQGVDLGGALESRKDIQAIVPLFATDLGRHPMPTPVIPPLSSLLQPNLEGRWSELEGVVHSVSTNGTLLVVGKDGPFYLWARQFATNSSTHCVDARIRARGVLTQTLPETPLLLVPSSEFIAFEEAAPRESFAGRQLTISNLLSETARDPWAHRVRLAGVVTYSDDRRFFIQDASGGIQIQRSRHQPSPVGQPVEVAGFPSWVASRPIITDSLVRPADSEEKVSAKPLDFKDALSSRQAGSLVQINAWLITRKSIGADEVLELQEQNRVFTATLTANHGTLPVIAPDSTIHIVGVWDYGMVSGSDEPAQPAQFLAPLNILLRSGEDVTFLSGPPWWTWRKTALLVGLLLMISALAMLWVQLLRHRLERQASAQVAFSQCVLGKLEEERRRIAVNLHDSLGQTLLVIKNHALLAAQMQVDEPDMRSRLDEISQITSQAIDEIRRITHGLRPYQLDHLGLTQAIRALIKRATDNTSISIASRIDPIDGLLDKDSEIHVYRIVQEAVTNVIKHSRATEATAVIKKRDAAISLSIRDNGNGFEPARPSSEPHDLGFGLNGIAERVRILKGTVLVESRLGGGTNLTAEIPIATSNASRL